jgi:hypothetical protein
MPKQAPKIDAATLRERAARCFRLAEGATQPEDQEVLAEIGRDYLEMAEEQEAAADTGRRRHKPEERG